MQEPRPRAHIPARPRGGPAPVVADLAAALDDDHLVVIQRDGDHRDTTAALRDRAQLDTVLVVLPITKLN